MKKLIELLKKLLGGSSTSSGEQKGFTLIELIIVIAILGILAAAVLAAIDPIDKLRGGNDTKVLGDIRQIYDASLRSYTVANIMPANLAAVQTSGELKSTPKTPTGYLPSPDYGWSLNTGAAGTATDVCVWAQVKSKSNVAKAAGATAANAYAVANNGKICYIVNAPANCTTAIVCP